MTWTDDRVERLKELWSDGLSASQIAKALGGGVSRNAVIGKVHRLRLASRGTTASSSPENTEAAGAPAPQKKSGGGTECEEREVTQPPAKADPEPQDDAVETKAEEPINPIAALAAEVERSARKLSLLDLNERTCKWPIGDPSTDDFYFCGLPCAPDKPYCAAHVAVAYQPLSSRRDRDRDRNRVKAG